MALIDGKSLLEHLLEGIKSKFMIEQVRVLTSVSSENKSIVDLCDQLNVQCFQGHENNVASRYKKILEANSNFQYFFRICGDSPFFSPELIIDAIDKVMNNQELELVTSLPNNGNPQGQNIEMVSSKSFLDSYPMFNKRAHFEHVTNYFYTHIDQFKHLLIFCDHPKYQYGDHKFSVDKKSDLENIKKLYQLMSKKHYFYNLNELIDLMFIIQNNSSRYK